MARPLDDSRIPAAAEPAFQHALDTYASETNKTASVWGEFADAHLDFKPHPRSSSVNEILRHQLLSERRFFGEFLGTPEPPPNDVIPTEWSIEHAIQRLVELAAPRLDFLSVQPLDWWLTKTKFFDVERQRVWIFWRRILHTAHHRTQLTLYLRMLEKPVPSTYGPTADVTWTGADPTQTTEAAGRK